MKGLNVKTSANISNYDTKVSNEQFKTILEVNVEKTCNLKS